MAGRIGGSNFGTWFLLLFGLVCGLVMGFILVVEAPPPYRLVMATGGKDGAYYRFATQYAQILAEQGLTLEVLETKGSVENLSLLREGAAEIALVQGGIAQESDADLLQSLGSLYREPLWIFYRGDAVLERIPQLEGKRVCMGLEGSGTRAIAMQLLQANAMDPAVLQTVNLGGNEAALALERGELDVAFFVASIDAAYIQRLVRDPEIHLAELNQTDAYLRRFRYLSTVTIPAGLLDLRGNHPPTEETLIAPAATLVASRNLHPALIPQLLKAATRVHRDGDLLSQPGEFPAAKFSDLPIHEQAEHYFRYGPPVLQRFMPFWLASLIDRTKLMIIPLLMLLMPLIRAAPPLVRWRTRRKIYLWYVTLREIDQKAILGMSTLEAQSSVEALSRLEQQIAQVGVPLSYMEEYYNLRLHLHLVRSRVEAFLERRPAPDRHAPADSPH